VYKKLREIEFLKSRTSNIFSIFALYRRYSKFIYGHLLPFLDETGEPEIRCPDTNTCTKFPAKLDIWGPKSEFPLAFLHIFRLHWTITWDLIS